MRQVQTGLDRLAASGFETLAGQRVGVLFHAASVDWQLRRADQLLMEADGVDLCALFGPQHGIFGQTQDNMIEWQGYKDPATGLPVHSLYGEQRQPTAAMLAGIDTLVIDLQDVGSRYYTFIWTMLLCLKACAAAGKRVVVLDRPNPLGGDRLEGTVLQQDFRSFVGLAPIPMRHGLTIGELACLFAHWQESPPQLEVIWMEGWRREMTFEATGLPWVMPSPNMPTVETAFVYPGGCLLEGTELSEGRGTTRPFEILGAPYIEPGRLIGELPGESLPGVLLRPLRFEPTFHKFAGQNCGGLQVHVTDRDLFRPVLTYTAIISTVRRLWPEHFAWRQPPYEYETQKLPIDILAGSPLWRQAIESGCSLLSMEQDWEAELTLFSTVAAEHLRYE